MTYQYEKDELLLLQISLLKNTVKIFNESPLEGSLYAIGSILDEHFDYVSDIDLIYIGENHPSNQLLKKNLSDQNKVTFDIAFLEPKEISPLLRSDDFNFLFLKQFNYQFKLLGGKELDLPRFAYEAGSYAKITQVRIHMIHSRICKKRLSNLEVGHNSLDGLFDKTFMAEGKEWISYKDIVGLYLTIADFLLVTSGVELSSKWAPLQSLDHFKSDPFYDHFKICQELYGSHGRYVPLKDLNKLSKFEVLFKDIDRIVADPRLNP
jgi:hypothetical protein